MLPSASNFRRVPFIDRDVARKTRQFLKYYPHERRVWVRGLPIGIHDKWMYTFLVDNPWHLPAPAWVRVYSLSHNTQ
jgi:hypothetical protein